MDADEVATSGKHDQGQGKPQRHCGQAEAVNQGIEQRSITRLRKAKATADAKPQQIFTAPMPQPPAIKPVTLTPAQRAWARPEPQTHRNAAWAAVAVAAALGGFILGGLAQ